MEFGHEVPNTAAPSLLVRRQNRLIRRRSHGEDREMRAGGKRLSRKLDRTIKNAPELFLMSPGPSAMKTLCRVLQALCLRADGHTSSASCTIRRGLQNRWSFDQGLGWMADQVRWVATRHGQSELSRAEFRRGFLENPASGLRALRATSARSEDSGKSWNMVKATPPLWGSSPWPFFSAKLNRVPEWRTATRNHIISTASQSFHVGAVRDATNSPIYRIAIILTRRGGLLEFGPCPLTMTGSGGVR